MIFLEDSNSDVRRGVVNYGGGGWARDCLF